MLLLGKVIIAIALLLVLANSLANLFWRLMPSPDINSGDFTPVATSAFEPVKQSGPPTVDIAKLKDIPLFGKEVASEPVTEAPEPVVVQEDVEETKLNLSLMGSFANENKEKAYAIIAKASKQSLYKVDDQIDGLSNVKLVSVFTDRVILDNRGKQEALYMYPEGESLSSGNVSADVVSRLEGGGGTRSLPKPVSAAKALSGISDNARLEKISDVIRFTRKTESGKMIGFRVLPGRNRAAFEQTGLQLNDVVTAIDGQSLDNLKAANQIYQQKRNATQASLTVLRNGEELAVDIDLNSINLN